MTNIKDIEGIADQYAKNLQSVGITSAEDLLNRGSIPQGRKLLAEQTGISAKQILRWVNHADLFRIKGVGGEYADLLEEAGVDTVVELGKRVPKVLLARMRAANEARHLVRRLPARKQVSAWVRQAKKLPRRIRY